LPSKLLPLILVHALKLLISSDIPGLFDLCRYTDCRLSCFNYGMTVAWWVVYCA